MRAQRNFGSFKLGSSVTVLATIIGCSGSDGSNPDAGGNAGAPGTGGAAALGGNSQSAAGASSTGGNASTGGAANLGGASVATGGANASGGIAASGGVNATGGTTAAGGSTIATGGSKATGGTSAIAGSKATGGTTSTGGSKSTGGAGAISSTGGTSTGAGTGGTTTAGGSTGASGAPGSSTELCTAWLSASTSESGWTGNVSTCTAGDMSATSRANALALVNLFRWIAALPAVTTSDQYNQDDQACALMMQANGQISHTPDSSWLCYTAAGANAATNSCVSGAGAVVSVAEYMVDPGNPTTLGHRRWVLSNYLGPIGIGSTGNYSCMYTGSTGNAGKAWIAWPAPGFFPLQAATDSWNRSINTTGWSVESDSINLAGAVVAVTLNGTNLPVTVAQLDANYGSRYAISFIPSGWTIAAGNTYNVSITGLATTIAYQVTVVSCS